MIQCLLGELNERRDGKTRSAKEAFLDDVIDALTKLDAAEEMPVIAVHAEDLHLVPRVHPEELDLISLADRMGTVEEALVNIQKTLTKKKPPPAHPAHTGGLPRNQEQRASTRPKEQKDPHKRISNMDRPRSGSRGSTGGGAGGATGGVPPTMAQVLAEALANCNAEDEEEPFKEQRPKKRPRKKGMQGTATSSKNALRGGADTFMVQVTNVNPAVDVGDIKQHIKDDQLNIVDNDIVVKDETTDGWPTKRFRITLPLKYFDDVMKPEFWPPKVYFRQFYPARGNGFEKNNSHR